MNAFFGMGIPSWGPNDLPGFFLKFRHLWPMFVVPVVCFYAILTVWVVGKVRSAFAGGNEPKSEQHPPGPGSLPPSQPPSVNAAHSSLEDKARSPLDLDFYRRLPLTS